MMILSIVIPVYNVQDYLERCLNSVVCCHENEIEIILVDDGSTDNSPIICDNYSKKYNNVKVIHQKNSGLSGARNTGMKHASGDYYFFLDSDDMIDKTFIGDMLDCIERYHADIMSFGFCEEKRTNKYQCKGDKKIELYTQNSYLKKILSNSLGCQICFRVYNKNLFQTINFPIGCYYEDIRTLWKIICCSEKIIHIDYTYYIYNLTNQSSITKKTNLKSMQDMKTSIDIMAYGILNHLKKIGKLDRRTERMILYYKLNHYVYISYKLRYVQDDENGFKKQINDYVIKQKINLWNYRKYDWKKYIVCKTLYLLHRL